MSHLLRDLAPITDEGWQQIDDEARRSLTLHLAARRLVDFVGPLGWDHAAIADGRVEESARRRLTEWRRRCARFSLSWSSAPASL